MKRSLFAAGAIAALVSTPVYAQNGALSGQCSAGAVQDVCQKSLDLFTYLAPQLGTAIAGGNAVLGQSGTLGFLHFSIGLRANAVRGSLPQVNDVVLSTTGAQRTTFATKDTYLPAPAAEVELGIFPGIPLGLTSVGSVDAIVSANYIPNYDDDSFSIKTEGNALKLGFGGRLGLLKESILVPGVSVTYLRRDLPTVSVQAPLTVSGGGFEDTLGVTGLSVKTTAIRGVVGKKFGILGLAVGAGQDRYDSRARLTGIVYEPPCTSGCKLDVSAPQQKVTRTTYFADLQLNLVIFKLVGEIGQVSGGSVTSTYNSFGDAKADDARTYGSIGVRFGF